MPFRRLEIDSIFATGLKNVRHFDFLTMRAYAVVSILGESSQPAKPTIVDRHGGVNPTWGELLQFTINDYAADQNRLTLVFRLRCERTLGDRDIGEVHVPVKDLLGKIGAFQELRRPVSTRSGETHGDLSFRCRIGEIDDTEILLPEPPPKSRFPRLKEASRKILTIFTTVGVGVVVDVVSDGG